MSEISPINNHLNRVKLSEAVPLATPFSVFVFPTTYCNFKCVYCAHSMSSRQMKEKYDLSEEHMSLDTYRKVIAQLQQFPQKLKLLSLTGQGEPMLNKNLPEMVHIAKKANVAERIEIISNGSLLTPDTSDALISAGLDGLRISLQGLDSEKYEEVCKFKINFNVFYENLTYFFKHRKSCNLFVKIMDVTLKDNDAEKFYRMFDGISDRMFIEICRPVYDGVQFTDNEHMKKTIVDRYGNNHSPRKVCPLCFFMLSVFPNGDVEPCDAIYKPIVLGNIHTETLQQMFLGEKLREFQLEQLKGNRNQNSKCAVCCAPDDVSHPLDVLDDSAEIIFNRMKGNAQ